MYACGRPTLGILFLVCRKNLKPRRVLTRKKPRQFNNSIAKEGREEMGSMEEGENNDHHQMMSSSRYSWWPDSHSRPRQSHRLQLTLSEMDKKIEKMVALIEDDGDTFAKRAEMYYRKRPQLIGMLEDLHKSYRALADKYDQLLLRSSHPTTTTANIPILVNRQVVGSRDGENRETAETIGNEGRFDCGREKVWNEQRVKVCKLVEENLRCQEELIRRNDEKREAILELYGRIHKLTNDNSALKTASALSCSRPPAPSRKPNRSHISRIRACFLGKFLPF